MGWMTVVQFPAGVGIFFFLQLCPDQLWGHPASYPIYAGSSFPGCKVAGAWSWPLTSV
jgi:hypothetical protein